MAKFILLNREEEYLQSLKNVTSAKGKSVINGEDTLDLTVFDVEVEKGYRILLQGQDGKWLEYIINEIEESHTDKGVKKNLYCESSLYETIGDFIEERRFNDTSAVIALTGVLQATRWQVGKVDNLGTASYSPYRVDAKTAIQEIAKRWQGELQTRIEVTGNKITGRYVDILSNIGFETGKRFTWTKDITKINRTVLKEDVYTALYGFGKGEEVGDGHGRRIDFSDINNGEMYVVNEEARLQFGRLNKDGTKAHIFGKVEFDDIEDKAEVKRLTELELEVLSKPVVSYSASVLNLKKYGYEHEGYSLGDVVLIIDKEFNPQLRVYARIIEKDTDYLDELKSDVTLGNFIPTSTSEDLKNEGYINNFRDKSGIWDRAGFIDSDGRIFIDDILDQINQQANATGGYFYYTEGEGTITTDKPIDQNPTMAVQIKGGIIRIANEKLPNGEWNWRTALTGKGIIADEINTGRLKASLIQAGFNDISDGFGVIITQDGMYSVAPSGEYTLLEEGGMKFFTRDDVLNGSIESSYQGDKTGVGIFIQPSHGFSVIRNNPEGIPNETIFQVPDDIDELKLIKPLNMAGQNIINGGLVSADSFNIKGTKQFLVNSSNGGGSLIDSLKVSLGIGTPSLWNNIISVKETVVEAYKPLDMKTNTIKNANSIETSNNGRESWYFTNGAGEAMLAGRYGTVLGSHDGTSASTKLKIPGTGAMVAYTDLNMNGKAITGTSDMRLKDKIEDVDFEALDKVDKMVFKFFEWKKNLKFNEGKPEGKRFGQIAQHAPKEMQVQNGDKNHFLSLDMQIQNDLNSMAIQELNKKTKKIEKLEQELADLKKLLTDKGLI